MVTVRILSASKHCMNGEPLLNKSPGPSPALTFPLCQDRMSGSHKIQIKSASSSYRLIPCTVLVLLLAVLTRLVWLIWWLRVITALAHQLLYPVWIENECMFKTDFDMRFAVLKVTTRKITARFRGSSINVSVTLICIYCVASHPKHAYLHDSRYLNVYRNDFLNGKLHM